MSFLRRAGERDYLVFAVNNVVQAQLMLGEWEVAAEVLAGADRNTLERLAEAAEEVVLPAGSTVIRQGDDPDAMWVLVRGELSVLATAEGGRPVELPPVTAPGYVGEVGLLHGIPRTATVRTQQQCTLLRIDGQDFLSAQQDSRPSASLVSVAGIRMARTQTRAPQPVPGTSR